MKRVALCGGSDWTDACCRHIMVPDSCQLERAATDWRSWYETHYLPQLHAGAQPKYLSFYQFLIRRYEASLDTEIEEFWVP